MDGQRQTLSDIGKHQGFGVSFPGGTINFPPLKNDQNSPAVPLNLLFILYSDFFRERKTAVA